MAARSQAALGGQAIGEPNAGAAQRPKRHKEAKHRLKEELFTEVRADRAYEAYRARGRMKDGRRLGGPPKPYTPPTPPEGRIDVTDPDYVFMPGTWSSVAFGQTAAVVPIGVPHSVRNTHDAPAKLVNSPRPAQRMKSFFVDGATLAGEGRIKRLPPKDPRPGP